MLSPLTTGADTFSCAQSTRSGAQEFALQLSDIRSVIFSFLCKKNHKATRLVCRSWNVDCMPLFWHDVDDVLMLFDTITPLDVHRKVSKP